MDYENDLFIVQFPFHRASMRGTLKDKTHFDKPQDLIFSNFGTQQAAETN